MCCLFKLAGYPVPARACSWHTGALILRMFGLQAAIGGRAAGGH